MIKYSITFNLMKECEDKQEYEDSVTRGYLTHRVIRTLRPHFRSQISCYINGYGLPSEIVEKFRNLLSRSFENYKTEIILILKYESLMNLCWGIDVTRQDRAHKKKNCTFEPGLYQKHTPAGEEFSIGDVKTMIKYSVTFNLMEECEDKQTYEDLVTKGVSHVIRQDRAYEKENCTFEPGLYQEDTPAGEEFPIGDVEIMIKYSITFNLIKECEYKQKYGDSVFRGVGDVIRQDRAYEKKNCTFEPGLYQKDTPAGEEFPIGDVEIMIKYSITFNLIKECEYKQKYGDSVFRGVGHVIRQDRAYKKKKCTFEPGFYQKHTPAGEEFSIGDVKTMIKYSVTFNLIEECGYKQTYEDSVTRGVSHVIRQDTAHKKKNCAFEPGLYQKRTAPGEEFPIEDEKTMIKYPITFNHMEECEDKQTYEDLVTRGYSTHRKPRTLRRYFRIQISCDINEYGLPPEIVEKFRNLQS
ncbi:hypothetical protein QAD02_023870 [Eretmocerus hayati]|uniref:Uncharacterized protein n=1 Tax=Eretmocerus hayati TaxID=131215 RepID=A0ACC2PWU8_9HYME|nr:hypothetical protein QAD02_023870 [Eretmocerus hayati]